MIKLDPAAVCRDDVLLDMIGSDFEVQADDELIQLLCSWRRELVTPPVTGAPIDQATALACLLQGRQRWNTPGRRIYRWLRDHGAAMYTRLTPSSRRT